MGGGKQQRKQQRQRKYVLHSSINQNVQTDVDQEKQLSNPFAVLPAITLNTKILNRLSARSLCCLAVVDRFLNYAASSDEVWEIVCSSKEWKQCVNSQLGWKKGFLEYHNKVCIECERRTDYVFAITKCRLCEKCEHQNPRYALATISEARDGYGLSYTELKELPYLDRYETRLFLRSQVAERALKLGKVLSTDARARNICVKTPLQRERSEAQAFLHGWESEEGEDDESDNDQDFDQDQDEVLDDLTFYMDDLGELSSSSSSSSSPASPDEKQIIAQEKIKAKKEADKVARKAHKKQVKQQNREKRAAKKEKQNKLGSSPKMDQSPPGQFHSKKGARRHNSYKYSKQVWKEARRQAGHTKELPRNMADTLGASPSQSRTYWLFEREDILQKWGLYDLSGLVLQTIQ